MLTCSRHILWAATHPIDLNENQANAVAARIELDLRIGAAFTRLQTLQLKTVSEKLEELTISYGNIIHVFTNFSNALQDLVSFRRLGL